MVPKISSFAFWYIASTLNYNFKLSDSDNDYLFDQYNYGKN